MSKNWIRVNSIAGNDKNAGRMLVKSSVFDLTAGFKGVVRHYKPRAFQVFEILTGVLLAEDYNVETALKNADKVIRSCAPLAERLRKLRPLVELPVIEDERVVEQWTDKNMPRHPNIANELVNIALPQKAKKRRVAAKA